MARQLFVPLICHTCLKNIAEFMIKNILILLLFTTIWFSGQSQMIVNTSGTIQNWVQNVLVGQGVSVSNIVYTGASVSKGTFTTGTTLGNIGFNSGLILSTGMASAAPGMASAFASTNTGGGSNPLLVLLSGVTIHDAVVLDFDFVPLSDTIKFQYVFGSEEYPEYVNSNVNDAFGFFISGLNPYGGNYTNQNIALIPNSTTPISINTVNQLSNTAYYNTNFGSYIKYDGFTTVLTAWALVIPCVTYHLKFAIGDGGDGIYDSGVFLKANSFTSNAVQVSQSTTNIMDSVAVEGCNNTVVTFRIPYVKSTPTIINYYPGGTATNGVDYNLIQHLVTVPAGQDSVNLIIEPILDGVTEPLEYVDLIITTSPCTYETVRVYIKDNNAPSISIPNDTILCGAQNVVLHANASGGYTPYNYLWSNGDTTDSTSYFFQQTGWYYGQITDLCQNTRVDSIFVVVSNPVFAAFGDSICLNDQATLSVQDNGNQTYLWSSGDTLASFVDTPLVTQNYNVVVTDTNGCFLDTTVTVTVFPLPIFTTSPDTSVCKGDFAPLRAYGNYDFSWSNGINSNNNRVVPLLDQVYYVTATDINQCQSNDSIAVEVISLPVPDITSSKDTSCRGSDVLLTASGGDLYSWNTGANTGDIVVSPMETTKYTVTATNINGHSYCMATKSLTIPVKRCLYIYVPNAFSPNGDGLNDKMGIEGDFTSLENFTFTIFDRNGMVLFTTHDEYQKWDGTAKGIDVPIGVYVYVIDIKEHMFEPYQLRGSVQVVR